MPAVTFSCAVLLFSVVAGELVSRDAAAADEILSEPTPCREHPSPDALTLSSQHFAALLWVLIVRRGRLLRAFAKLRWMWRT